MRTLLTILAFTLTPLVARAECPKVLDLGTVLNAVALNAGASSLTVTVGPTETDPLTGSTQQCQVAWYDKIVFDVSFDYTAQAGAISATVTGGATAATATRSLTTCTVSSGNCTVNMGGVATTASLSADTAWLLPVSTNNARAIKAVFAHGGTPGATDKLTVKAWLVKE